MAAVQKKFVIKAFRAMNSMDLTEANKTIALLETAIDQIYNRNASQLRFEELYRLANCF
jgi:hypothetical protein